MPGSDIYGVLEYDTAYIIRGVFDRALQEAGFSTSATLSYLKANRMIDTRERGYTKTKRIGKTTPQCVCLRMNTDDWTASGDPTELLPL